MADMPEKYYSRFDPGKRYERHLFIAGRHVQSAEWNEMQESFIHRLRQVADVIFADGDIVRDGACTIDSDTGLVRCESGAIYVAGAVRGVAPAEFVVPVVGQVAIGVWLHEVVVTALEDPELRNPAANMPSQFAVGAERLRIDIRWGWSGDGGPGEFYAVRGVNDGNLQSKEAPPAFDAMNLSLAKYDRDSAGGTYIVAGLGVTQMPDAGGDQVYSVSEGRARIYGHPVELYASRRAVFAATPDLRRVNNEPFLSSGVEAQRVDLDQYPVADVVSVSITTDKLTNLVHGVSTGASDRLPDDSVIEIISVTQGAQTYVEGTDYILDGSYVDWSPAGAEPSPGSTYAVEYRYIKTFVPEFDNGGFEVSGAVAGTLILSTYDYKLPRVDRLCLTTLGDFVWIIGVSATDFPRVPKAPTNLLPLATIYQTWDDNRRVVADGVRMVPMQDLAAIEGRIDRIADLLAQQRLESSIHTRETGAKKGLFTDPFLNDSHRDAGQAQTAAVVRGSLLLPIDATIHQLSGLSSPATLAYAHEVALEQLLKSGEMQINPYMAFVEDTASLSIFPSVDRWTEVVDDWGAAETGMFDPDDDDEVINDRTALLPGETQQIENLRQISVDFEISGFIPGEVLDSLLFDGQEVSPGPFVANAEGEINSSFTIPAGVPAGTKSVECFGSSGSHASALFFGQGILEVRRWSPLPPPPSRTIRPFDPIAQTFTLDVVTQVSAVEVWFVAPPTTDAIIQIRETAVGFPTQAILAEARLSPPQVLVDGSPTLFEFDVPVTLFGGTEYAIVALCNDPVGALAVAELGKFDPDAMRWITSQPYTVGVLLSSSNASTWTAHQDRDLAFRVLRAGFTETARDIALGTVSVVDATDLLLLSFSELPSSVTMVEYTLTFPDDSVITVSEGQPVQLSSAVTGDIDVGARLYGSGLYSPVLHPEIQLVVGSLQSSAVYITRAVPAGNNTTIKAIVEALIPSGAAVSAFYKGIDLGDDWVSLPQTGTFPADDGFVELTFSAENVADEAAVHVKLEFSGSPAARPRFRDMRVVIV